MQSLLRDFKLLYLLVADGRRESNIAVWYFSPHRPQVEDDTVGIRQGLGNLFRLLGGYIKHLHTSGCDFFSVVVEMLVPLLQRHVRARELLVNEVFDLNKLGIWTVGQKNHALQDLWFNLLAIMVIRAVYRAVFVTMGRDDMNVVAIRRAFCLLLSE